MTDLPQRLQSISEAIEAGRWMQHADADTCREAAELIDRLPRDANGTPYTHGDVLRLTTDPQIRAMAVMCLKPLDDDGCVRYCTLAGAWAKVDSTEKAARGARGDT